MQKKSYVLYIFLFLLCLKYKDAHTYMKKHFITNTSNHSFSFCTCTLVLTQKGTYMETYSGLFVFVCEYLCVGESVSIFTITSHLVKKNKACPLCLSPLETKNRDCSMSATGELHSPTIWERETPRSSTTAASKKTPKKRQKRRNKMTRFLCEGRQRKHSLPRQG